MSNYYCSGGCPLSTPKKEASAATTTKPKITTVAEKAGKCSFAAVKEVKTEGKNDQVPPPCGANIESKDAAAVMEVKTEGKNDQVQPPSGAKIESKDAAAVQVKEEVKVTCTCG